MELLNTFKIRFQTLWYLASHLLMKWLKRGLLLRNKWKFYILMINYSPWKTDYISWLNLINFASDRHSLIIINWRHIMVTNLHSQQMFSKVSKIHFRGRCMRGLYQKLQWKFPQNKIRLLSIHGWLDWCKTMS